MSMINCNTYQSDFIIVGISCVETYTRDKDKTIRQSQYIMVRDTYTQALYRTQLIHDFANNSFVPGDIIKMTYTVKLYDSKKQPGKIVPYIYAKSIQPIRTRSPYPWLTPDQVAMQLKFEQTQIFTQNENNFSDKYNIK